MFNCMFNMFTAPDSMRCDDGWTEFGGSCYKFVKKSGETAFSWYESRFYCQQEGADLASIQSQAENDFVLSNIAPSKSSELSYDQKRVLWCLIKRICIV